MPSECHCSDEIKKKAAENKSWWPDTLCLVKNSVWNERNFWVCWRMFMSLVFFILLSTTWLYHKFIHPRTTLTVSFVMTLLGWNVWRTERATPKKYQVRVYFWKGNHRYKMSDFQIASQICFWIFFVIFLGVIWRFLWRLYIKIGVSYFKTISMHVKLIVVINK